MPLQVPQEHIKIVLNDLFIDGLDLYCSSLAYPSYRPYLQCFPFSTSWYDSHSMTRVWLECCLAHVQLGCCCIHILSDDHDNMLMQRMANNMRRAGISARRSQPQRYSASQHQSRSRRCARHLSKTQHAKPLNTTPSGLLMAPAMILQQKLGLLPLFLVQDHCKLPLNHWLLLLLILYF